MTKTNLTKNLLSSALISLIILMSACTDGSFTGSGSARNPVNENKKDPGTTGTPGNDPDDEKDDKNESDDIDEKDDKDAGVEQPSGAIMTHKTGKDCRDQKASVIVDKATGKPVQMFP